MDRSERNSKEKILDGDTQDWRTQDGWQRILKRSSLKFCLKILLDKHRSREEIVDAVKSLNPRPFGVSREKGDQPVWSLAFKPSDFESLEKLKGQQTIKIGRFTCRNLHFNVPNGEIAKIYNYVIDIRENLFLPLEMVEKALMEKGVMVHNIMRDSFKGIETGYLTVIAGTKHVEEVKFSVDEIGLVLQSLKKRLLSKKKARQKKRTVFPGDQASPARSTSPILIQREPSIDPVDTPTKKKKKKKKEKADIAIPAAPNVPNVVISESKVQCFEPHRSDDEEDAKPTQKAPQTERDKVLKSKSEVAPDRKSIRIQSKKIGLG
jgi:hypothetical protein